MIGELRWMSEALHGPANAWCAFPDGGIRRVLMLLHGLTDDSTSWLENSHVRELAHRYAALIVMPEGGRSFWQNTSGDGQFRDLITHEIPEILGRNFNVPDELQAWAIAGNSMGGYGALVASCLAPERFSRCGAFSPVLSPGSDVDAIPQELLLEGEPTQIRRKAEEWPELRDLVSECPALPSMWVSCGTVDFLASSNEAFARHLAMVGVSHVYRTPLGSGHEWTAWDEDLEDFLTYWSDDRRQPEQP